MPRRATARPVSTLFRLWLALGLCAGAARAQAAAPATEPEIPEATGFVNDVAGVMDEPSRVRLEAFLDQLRAKTGAEFAVLTIRTTAPLSPSEYKVKVFERWGIGRREQDDGLLMLVAIEEREVRFETGYGLEGSLPDGLQSRIFRQEIAPRFRKGDFSGGITAGAIACAGRIAAEKGVTLEWNGRQLRYEETRAARRNGRVLLVLLLVVLLVVLLSIVLANAAGGGWRVQRRRRGWMHSGGYWSGRFGGFGGFGGGGFGGGSFGGFGGGASGGGGGGGKW